MGIYKYVSILGIIIFGSYISYNHFQEKKRLTFIEKQIRQDFKEHLVEMPQVDYIDLLGNQPSDHVLKLGRFLFNDPVMSRNNDVSCATCHLTNHGFADGNSLSVGSTGKGGPHAGNVGKAWGTGVLSLDREFDDDGLGYRSINRMFRNTLSTVNVAFRMRRDNTDGLFNDGRFGSLFFQTIMPIHTDLELCGTNPVAQAGNPFEPGGVFFRTAVEINHANTFDDFEGRELGEFNAVKTFIRGVPTFRPNGVLSTPGRNECLAIAIAKLRSIPAYRNLFEKAFGTPDVTDQRIGIALTSFILTHVSKNSPFDKFVKGQSSLSEKQLRGMVSFFTPIGEKYKVGEKEVFGAGCFKCHDAPFGGTGYVSLGVRSDLQSTLAKPSNLVDPKSSFFGRNRLQRGIIPSCHIPGVTISSDNIAPDIGRANATFKTEDCFKFRVPPLKNVIETYPYFHHGTARAQGSNEKNFKKRSIEALKQVVAYHLRGPIDSGAYSTLKGTKVFYDELEQKDYFVPVFSQNFISKDLNDKQHDHVLELFPVEYTSEELDDLVDFISYGLYDPMTVKLGDLRNDVSHPKKVPSGFLPSVTRDDGNQTEIPPASRFK